MFNRLTFLLALIVLGASALVLRLPQVEAQVPCFPTSPLSTTCAPVTYPVTICADRFAPYAYSGYYFGMPVAFFGQTYIYNAPNPYNFYNLSPPHLLRLQVQQGSTFASNTIVSVEVLPDLCTPAAAPTPVPTQAPQIVYVPQPVAAPARQPVPLGEKAGISPPKTGDAGLASE